MIPEFGIDGGPLESAMCRLTLEKLAYGFRSGARPWLEKRKQAHDHLQDFFRAGGPLAVELFNLGKLPMN